MVEMLEAKGILEKVGNKLSYVSPITGEEIKEFRKGWTGDKLEIVMDEFGQNPNKDNDVQDDIDIVELDNSNEEDLIDES
jgi:hypothetical protein